MPMATRARKEFRLHKSVYFRPGDFTPGNLTMEECLRGASAPVRAVLENSLESRELGFEDGHLLASVEGDDLRALVKVADQKRRQRAGDTVTYVVNRNINFTNVCFVGCAFCGFGRGPQAHDAYFLPMEQVVAKALDAAARGATEVCIQGGLPRDLEGFYYRDLLRAIKSALPSMHVHAFSPMEIAYGVEKTGMLLRDYLLMLKSEGLASIPGTAAEILDDKVRAALSPNKLTVNRWVEIIRAAHAAGLPSTSTMMYGHVERPEHWVRHLMLLRDIQKDTGGITEFVPLAFIHENTRLYRRDRSRPGSSLREDLVVHALARLMLDGWVRNVQVSWVKLGFEVSLACLEAGANDFGGTLMEESISKSAGATFGEYVAPEEFRALIRRIDRLPAERNTLYGLRKLYSPAAEDDTAEDALAEENPSEPCEVSPSHAAGAALNIFPDGAASCATDAIPLRLPMSINSSSADSSAVKSSFAKSSFAKY
jgi:7,8-didemethyl-8-hydroxy-5-deazariboflavin synthase CofH subunit